MRFPRVKAEGQSFYHCISRVVEDRFIFQTAAGGCLEAEKFLSHAWLYLEISRIVHQKDVGNRLIRDLKSQMLRSIGSSSLLAPVEMHTLKTRASTAALAEFRAEVWRIDLNKLATPPLRPAIGLSAHKRDWRTNALTVEYEVIIET